MFLGQGAAGLDSAIKVLFYPHSLQLLSDTGLCFLRINEGSRISIPVSREVSMMVGNGQYP